MLYPHLANKQSATPLATASPLAAAEPHTVEPYLAEARTLVSLTQQRPFNQASKRLVASFVALADGNTVTGLLAYYLWRRAARRCR